MIVLYILGYFCRKKYLHFLAKEINISGYRQREDDDIVPLNYIAKGVVYRVNNNGPNTDTWGTPHAT